MPLILLQPLGWPKAAKPPPGHAGETGRPADPPTRKQNWRGQAAALMLQPPRCERAPPRRSNARAESRRTRRRRPPPPAPGPFPGPEREAPPRTAARLQAGSAASGSRLKFCRSLKARGARTPSEFEDVCGWWLRRGPRGEGGGPRHPLAWTVRYEKVRVSGRSRGRRRDIHPYRVGGPRGRPWPGAVLSWGGAREAGDPRGRAGKPRAAQGPRGLARRRPVRTLTFPAAAPQGAG